MTTRNLGVILGVAVGLIVLVIASLWDLPIRGLLLLGVGVGVVAGLAIRLLWVAGLLNRRPDV